MKDKKVSILKGIGIFMVVYGHALIPYAYPLIVAANVTIFFFVIGWTYHYEKYADHAGKLIGTRLHTFMIPYIGYMLCYLLLHNTFYRLGLYLGEDVLYTDFQTYINVFVGYFQLGFDSLCGAVWFMAPYFISVALWGNIVSFINRKYKESCTRLWIWVSVICCLAGIAGVMLIEMGIRTGYRWEIALLMLPVIVLGKIISMYYDKLQRYIRSIGAIVALGG